MHRLSSIHFIIYNPATFKTGVNSGDNKMRQTWKQGSKLQLEEYT